MANMARDMILIVKVIRDLEVFSATGLMLYQVSLIEHRNLYVWPSWERLKVPLF